MSSQKINKSLWKHTKYLSNELQGGQTRGLDWRAAQLQKKNPSAKLGANMKILKRFRSEADQGLSSELDALRQDLESLETRPGELASTNLKFAAKLKAEEEVGQALQRGTAEGAGSGVHHSFIDGCLLPGWIAYCNVLGPQTTMQPRNDAQPSTTVPNYRITDVHKLSKTSKYYYCVVNMTLVLLLFHYCEYQLNKLQ